VDISQGIDKASEPNRLVGFNVSLYFILFFILLSEYRTTLTGLNGEFGKCRKTVRISCVKPRIDFWHPKPFHLYPTLRTSISRVLLQVHLYTCTYCYKIPVQHNSFPRTAVDFTTPPPHRGYCSNNIFGCHDKLNDLARVTFHIHTSVHKIYVHMYNISIRRGATEGCCVGHRTARLPTLIAIWFDAKVSGRQRFIVAAVYIRISWLDRWNGFVLTGPSATRDQSSVYTSNT